MNQVEFLGLVHTFATVSPSNMHNVLHQNCSKRHRYLSRDSKILSDVVSKCYVIINDLAISLPLFGNKPKKFDFFHQTVSSQAGGTHGWGTKLRKASQKNVIFVAWIQSCWQHRIEITSQDIQVRVSIKVEVAANYGP